MGYAEFAYRVLLEALSQKLWNSLSPTGSKVRRFVRGIRRAREGAEIASLKINRSVLGEQTTRNMMMGIDRRFRTASAISDKRVPGNKKYVK